MKLKIFQVDAFADKVFFGNPAAVVLLKKWLDSSIMQKIAHENNLAETAFFVEEEKGFEIRWFTPTTEVPLCGHATLASAHVLFEHFKYKKNKIIFHSQSGKLIVEKKQNLICLNFPVDLAKKIKTEKTDNNLLYHSQPINILKSPRFYLLELSSEKEVREVKPNHQAILSLDRGGVIITAKGNEVDFVSRFFAPQWGINEDPVTGAAHTTLIPYWAKKLKKTKLNCHTSF